MNTCKIAVVLFFAIVYSYSSVFYVDPQNGSISNDGSLSEPWNTLSEVLDSGKIETRMYESKPVTNATPFIPKNSGAPVKAGDTLMLYNGYHGKIFSREFYNEDYITIMAKDGHTPKVASLELRSGCKWIVRGLTISPSFATPYTKTTMLQFSSHSWTGSSWGCVAEACTAYSVLDASGWTKEEWSTSSCNAVNVPGNNTVIRDCYFLNVNFGISVTGDSCLIENNTIKNFAGDALRGLGDYDVFQYNTIKNCYDVNANHDDGFQSWSVGSDGKVGTGVVYGMVLRGNTIINYENPNQPFIGTLQGIGCFDGMFENWLVENNVVITDHWHGITLSGAINCVIVNNTVVDLNEDEPGPPWIRIGDHKNSTLSTGCIVRNNLSKSFNISSKDVIEDHNIKIDNYDDIFVDYKTKDLYLKDESPAIDSGSLDKAPAFDKNKNLRPFGSRVDIGAYEWGYTGIKKNVNLAKFQKPCVCYNCNNMLIIKTENINLKQVCIYDIKGRLITSFENTDKTIVWEINNFGKGIYFVNVIYGNNIVTSKVIVQ